MTSLIPGMEAGSDSHDSVFAPTKTDAVLFLPPNRHRPAYPPRVVLRGVSVTYAPSLTMLGTEINAKLTFGPHIARTAEHAAIALHGVGLLTRLQPVRLLLRESLFRLALRAIAAPPSHPLHHRALMPALDVRIDYTKEKALETHLAEISSLPSESLLVYSDGSLSDGRAGAGVVSRAVLLGEEEVEGILRAALRGQLGVLQTVCVAELEGLRLALATLAGSPPPAQPTIVLIAIDNQAVLLQPPPPAPTLGQQHRLMV
ncbi:hypothetical protein JCM10450v2_005202 [Rhodotorula kratochvilovae]